MHRSSQRRGNIFLALSLCFPRSIIFDGRTFIVHLSSGNRRSNDLFHTKKHLLSRNLSPLPQKAFFLHYRPRISNAGFFHPLVRWSICLSVHLFSAIEAKNHDRKLRNFMTTQTCWKNRCPLIQLFILVLASLTSNFSVMVPNHSYKPILFSCSFFASQSHLQILTIVSFLPTSSRAIVVFPFIRVFFPLTFVPVPFLA